MICIEAGVSATPYLRGGAVLRQLHRNIWKGELCLLSTCSACYPREQTHTYCRSAMSSQNTRLQSLPASSRAAYLGALPALILLMLSHGSMRVSGDACQCWDDKISGFTGGNLGTVSRSKEPLFNATLMWDVKGIKAALAAGSNVNGVSGSEPIKGMTPLQAALMTTSDPYWHPYRDAVYAVVKVLLDAGANPNIPFPKDSPYAGSNPLLWAAYDGRDKLVQMMIKAGANIKAKNSNGNTALHEAAFCDFRLSWDPRAFATAKLLLAYGASLNATNKDGKTPFQVTPGYPDCKGTASDASDCPMVCKVLRDGLSAADRAAILAGHLPDDGSRKARKCCKDPVVNGYDYSQCCLS